jgi:hypothetical protein
VRYDLKEKSEYIYLNMNGENKICNSINKLVYEFVSRINYDSSIVERIYLSRHGKSEFNKEDRIGGDSDLT